MNVRELKTRADAAWLTETATYADWRYARDANHPTETIDRLENAWLAAKQKWDDSETAWMMFNHLDPDREIRACSARETIEKWIQTGRI